MTDYNVGNTIRKLREARGWSQRKLATEVGLSQSNINQIENNILKLNKLETVNKFLNVFNIEFDFLFQDYINAFNEVNLSNFEKDIIIEINLMNLKELKAFRRILSAFIDFKSESI